MTEYLSIHYDTLSRGLGCGNVEDVWFCDAAKQFALLTGSGTRDVLWDWIEAHFKIPRGAHIFKAEGDPINARSVRFSYRVPEILTIDELPYYALVAIKADP